MIRRNTRDQGHGETPKADSRRTQGSLHSWRPLPSLPWLYMSTCYIQIQMSPQRSKEEEKKRKPLENEVPTRMTKL